MGIMTTRCTKKFFDKTDGPCDLYEPHAFDTFKSVSKVKNQTPDHVGHAA